MRARPRGAAVLALEHRRRRGGRRSGLDAAPVGADRGLTAVLASGRGGHGRRRGGRGCAGCHRQARRIRLAGWWARRRRPRRGGSRAPAWHAGAAAERAPRGVATVLTPLHRVGWRGNRRPTPRRRRPGQRPLARRRCVRADKRVGALASGCLARRRAGVGRQGRLCRGLDKARGAGLADIVAGPDFGSKLEPEHDVELLDELHPLLQRHRVGREIAPAELLPPGFQDRGVPFDLPPLPLPPVHGRPRRPHPGRPAGWPARTAATAPLLLRLRLRLAAVAVWSRLRGGGLCVGPEEHRHDRQSLGAAGLVRPSRGRRWGSVLPGHRRGTATATPFPHRLELAVEVSVVRANVVLALGRHWAPALDFLLREPELESGPVAPNLHNEEPHVERDRADSLRLRGGLAVHWPVRVVCTVGREDVLARQRSPELWVRFWSPTTTTATTASSRRRTVGSAPLVWWVLQGCLEIHNAFRCDYPSRPSPIGGLVDTRPSVNIARVHPSALKQHREVHRDLDCEASTQPSANATKCRRPIHNCTIVRRVKTGKNLG
eukprot:m.206374 g.206374  ORF g.206374 m.206374 type:complete len:547 (-) comp25350_c0_seq2:135-1775(-)